MRGWCRCRADGEVQMMRMRTDALVDPTHSARWAVPQSSVCKKQARARLATAMSSGLTASPMPPRKSGAGAAQVFPTALPINSSRALYPVRSLGLTTTTIGASILCCDRSPALAYILFAVIHQRAHIITVFLIRPVQPLVRQPESDRRITARSRGDHVVQASRLLFHRGAARSPAPQSNNLFLPSD
jgi:hypothetical protein